MMRILMMRKKEAKREFLVKSFVMSFRNIANGLIAWAIFTIDLLCKLFLRNKNSFLKKNDLKQKLKFYFYKL